MFPSRRDRIPPTGCLVSSVRWRSAANIEPRPRPPRSFLRLLVSLASCLGLVLVAPAPAAVLTVLGPPQVVTGPSAEPVDHPAVALRADGSFAVAWGTDPNSAQGDVFLRTYSASGVPTSEAVVVGETALRREPAIATNDAGNLLVAWWIFEAGFARLGWRGFDRLARPLGEPVRLEPDGTRHDQDAQVVARVDGGFWLFWNRNWSDYPDYHYEVRALPLGPGGAAEAEATVLLAEWRLVGAVGDGVGGYLLAVYRPSGDTATLAVQRLDADGMLVGEPIPVATSGSFHERPAIAPTPDHGFAVAWVEDVGGWPRGFVRSFDATNDPHGEAVELAPGIGLRGVAMAATTRGFVVVWATDGDDVSARGFDGTGTPLADAEPLDPSHPVSLLRLTATGTGDWAVAAWVRSPQVGQYSVVFTGMATGCTGGGDLCLLEDRFVVRMSWRTREGAHGDGAAIQLAGRSGAMWFFAADNYEVFVKMLDACSYNGYYWFFAAGLTNVEVSIEVIDRQTGTVRTYDNPLGRYFPPTFDTAAFATCG
jgi:hypothetical protein